MYILAVLVGLILAMLIVSQLSTAPPGTGGRGGGGEMNEREQSYWTQLVLGAKAQMTEYGSVVVAADTELRELRAENARLRALLRDVLGCGVCSTCRLRIDAALKGKNDAQ